MARDLRRIGEEMVWASLPTMAAVLVLGFASHFYSKACEREVRAIGSKTFQTLTEKDGQELQRLERALYGCEDALGIAAYGLFVPVGMAAAGGGLCGVDNYGTRRRKKGNQA